MAAVGAADMSAAGTGEPRARGANDWNCPRCSKVVWGSKDTCFSCGSGKALPSVASAAAASASAAAASSLGISLGLSDPMQLDLEDFKTEGAPLAAPDPLKKKRKVTHATFFEDDKGLKKMLKTFPSIKFRGKGSEYEDVSLLLNHYKKWFQELCPYGDHFEDLVLKARSVLEDKEKEDDGTVSDPRERMHAFRFQYKNEKEASSAAAKLSDEQRARIEASRQRALELKRQKEQRALDPEGKSSEASAAPAPAQELDMEELWNLEQENAAAAGRQQTSQGQAPDEFEDDPFGYGGGFDEEDGGLTAAPRAAASAPVPFFTEEEEDVFGFGGGFDEDDAPPAPKMTTAPMPEAPPPAAAQVDPEVARRIAENRAKALARKAAAAEAAAAAAAAAEAASEAQTLAPPEALPEALPEAASAAPGSAPAFAEEENPFGDDCFGGFDDP